MGYTNRTFSIAKKSFDKYNLVYLTWSRFENDWPSTLHFHAFTEIMYIVNGEGRLKLDTDTREIKQGDIIIINPSTPHTETSEVKNCLEYYVFAIENISFNVSGDAQDNVFINNIKDIDGRKLLQKLFKNIEAELVSQKAYYEVYVQSLVNEVLVYILRETDVKDIEYKGLSTPSECAFIKRYIDLHFSDKITLDEIAKKTFFSKFYIIHTFKQHYGITPVQYLLEKRLEEAASLLKTSNISVTSICTSVGFSSPSQLAKAFYSKYGYTPLKYRAIKSNCV